MSAALLAFLRAFWPQLLGLAIVLGIIWGVHHTIEAARAEGDHTGYQRAKSEDEKVANEQRIRNAQKEAAYEKQIAGAYKAFDEVNAQLAVARRAKPAGHFVCNHAPSADRVPEGPGISGAQAPDAGVLPGQAGQGDAFDPGPDLYALADEADDMLASCRLLHQAVHGVPTR